MIPSSLHFLSFLSGMAFKQRTDDELIVMEKHELIILKCWRLQYDESDKGDEYYGNVRFY